MMLMVHEKLFFYDVGPHREALFAKLTVYYCSESPGFMYFGEMSQRNHLSTCQQTYPFFGLAEELPDYFRLTGKFRDLDGMRYPRTVERVVHGAG
jgi:hypothetical protein